MSCARNINFKNEDGSIPTTIITTRCRKYKKKIPTFKPIISSLSSTSSGYNENSVIQVNGFNFFPSAYGTTYIQFGNYKIPIVFYNSFSISFFIPLRVKPGTYNLQVVNIYNNNLSSSINQSYSGNLNYSNTIFFKIYTYKIIGTYYVTSNPEYNTIITFTENSTITFYFNYLVQYIIVGSEEILIGAINLFEKNTYIITCKDSENNATIIGNNVNIFAKKKNDDNCRISLYFNVL